MLALELRFPGGRYHATPWGHHVNEGIVEWPPSPWRLLRALIATWHLKARSDVSEETVATLVERLASELPHYDLPASSSSHTRHYMPLYREETTKILDTFLHVGNHSACAIWPYVEFGATEQQALELLLSRLGYLGRAESWVEARCVSGQGWNPKVLPAEAGGQHGDGDFELVRVLAPLPPSEYGTWRASSVEHELERLLDEKRQLAARKGKSVGGAKLTANEQATLSERFPPTLLDALEADVGDLKKLGWSLAPGARWVDYRRPRGLVDPSATVPRRVHVGKLPTVARFAVASQVPPRLTYAVSLAEKIRESLMKWSDGAEVFSGRRNGERLQGHEHAFFLPESNGNQAGRVTHVTVCAPAGFDARARRALDQLRKVWGYEGHDVQLVLLGVGKPEDFAGINLEAGQCPLLCDAEVWVSRTPFVPTRHPKMSRRGVPKVADGIQIGSAEHDLRRLLREALRLPDPVRVEPVAATSLGGKPVSWLSFEVERRSGGGVRGANRGYGFRIRFSERISGPIAVGYGAHFGLGVFVPDSTC